MYFLLRETAVTLSPVPGVVDPDLTGNRVKKEFTK
jgi:hypothetical protein